jgi:spore coat protein H
MNVEVVEIMKSWKIASLLVSVTLILNLFSGCSSGSKTNTNANNTDSTSQSKKITDNKGVYSKDNDEVENIYVTVVTDNSVTMDEVDDWNIDLIEPKPEINVRFDYGSPAADLTGVKANAVMSQRGQLSTMGEIKSYKIELSKTTAEWKGMDELNLNKHPFDLTRIRNKLAFDLMKMFPDTFSFRMQFCHLYIRNLNSGNKNYEDYGLYTNTEDLGKDYLKSRGIEKNAFIYKAYEFGFNLNPDIKNVTDQGYNKAAFEKILSIKGVEDHTRLIAMLQDVNDETQDINAVIEKHFDRSNYITWMAINLLMNNTDTSVNNFYIMSPESSDKWYFVPWDFDFSLGHDYQLGDYYYQVVPPYVLSGVSMYWGSALHRRFLQNPENVKELTAKIEELSAIATNEVVAAKVDKLYASTNALIKSSPDADITGNTVANYESEIQRLKTMLDEDKKIYYKGLKIPMPFNLYDVKEDGNERTFSWGKSYSLDGDSLHYNFYMSETPDFNEGYLERLNLQDTTVTIDKLPVGTYYWKVEAEDPDGNVMVAFDAYYSETEESEYFGIREYVVH